MKRNKSCKDRYLKEVVKTKQLHDDDHIACFSYPNCEEGPRGCIVLYGDEAEPYGHRP
jgi:hypothetical protein